MPLYPPSERLRPFGLRKTPFNPITGKFFPMGDDRVIGVFELIEEEASTLLCLDTRIGREVRISKPYMFRRDIFNGETVNEVSYSFTGNNSRTASKDGEEDEAQVITPDYLTGETIIAVRREVNVTLTDGTLYKCRWEDINIAGRCWAVEVE